MRLGEHIRSIRRQRDWTQEYLAEQAGLHVTYIISLEKGKKSASVDTLKKISDAFCITLPDLFAFDSIGETTKDKKISALMQEYTEKLKRIIE